MQLSAVTLHASLVRDLGKSFRTTGSAPPVPQRTTRLNADDAKKLLAGKGRHKQLPKGPEGLDELVWDDITGLTSDERTEIASKNDTNASGQHISDDNDDEMI